MPKPEKRKKLTIKKTFVRRKRKQLYFLQKNIKNSGRPNFNVLLNSLSKQDYFRTDISLFPNNVFCTFKNVGQNKLISRVSAGKYKLKVSKKSLKYASKLVITNFFRDLKKKKVSFSKPMILVLVSPVNLRKKIIISVFNLLKNVKNKRIAFFVKPKKFFNGCRAKKQIRKKQKRYAIYK